jgi:hypothetical protein
MFPYYQLDLIRQNFLTETTHNCDNQSNSKEFLVKIISSDKKK